MVDRNQSTIDRASRTADRDLDESNSELLVLEVEDGGELLQEVNMEGRICI